MKKNFSLKDGIEYHKAGNLQLADKIYKSLLDLDPLNVKLLSLRAIIAQSFDRFDVAIKFFERANLLQPKEVNIQLQLAISYGHIGNLEKANLYYEKAIELAPGNIEPLVNYGNNLTKLHRFEEALNVYERALKIEPGFAKLHYNIGTMHLKEMSPDRAIGWLEKAVTLDVNYSTAWNSLGVAFSELGNLRQALEAYQKASALDPLMVEPLFNMHAVYIDLDLPDLSIKALEKAVSIDKHNNTLNFFLSMTSQYYGHEDKNMPLLDLMSGELDVSPEISSWNYLKSICLSLPLLVGTNTKTIEIAIAAAKISGLNLEFGVYKGKSIRTIAALIKESIHGFDSFEGIPENWNNEPKGSYSAGGRLPEVPKNVILHKGWFNETLPIFLEKYKQPVSFLHIDCDLYSSTKTILDLLSTKILKGTVIVFDEFIGYQSWNQDEFKAFMEAAQLYRWDYELLSFSFVTKQVAIIIK